MILALVASIKVLLLFMSLLYDTFGPASCLAWIAGCYVYAVIVDRREREQ